MSQLSILLPLLFERDDVSTEDQLTCSTSNDYNGHSGLRILAVFIILISSGLGVFFPIMSSRYSFIRLPEWCFFIAKFFGSGVIVSTAFIHLLQPASEALGDECLGGTFAEYPWAFGICLMSLFALFFTEIVSHYFVAKSLGDEHDHSHGGNTASTAHHVHAHAPHEHNHAGDYEMDHLHSDESFDDDELEEESSSLDSEDIDLHPNNHQLHNELASKKEEVNDDDDRDNHHPHPHDLEHAYKTRTQEFMEKSSNGGNIPTTMITLQSSQPGKDHFSHETNHQDPTQLGTPVEQEDKEKYLNQIVAVSILEAGIIFHSVFVGLSLSVSGEEFETLFIVLTFHQMFEGLGLGTRVAETNWPHSKRNTPWLMGLAFTLTSPIAVAIGIGVRHSWIPGSRKALIANGVFDSISSGILIYTGLVELMAHEFLFSNQFKGHGGLKRMLSAYLIMCLGAGLMALLGKWA